MQLLHHGKREFPINYSIEKSLNFAFQSGKFLLIFQNYAILFKLLTLFPTNFQEPLKNLQSYAMQNILIGNSKLQRSTQNISKLSKFRTVDWKTKLIHNLSTHK